MVNVILTKDFHQVQLLAEVKEFTAVVAAAMVLLLAQCFLWRPLRPQRPLRLLLLLRRVLLLRRMFPMLLDLLLLLLLHTLGLINSFANQLFVKFKKLRRSSWFSISRWLLQLNLKAFRLRCSINTLSSMVRITLRGADKVMPDRVLGELLLPFSFKVPLAS